MIPTRDRRELLQRCLDAIRAQETAIVFEVIVVDDGSTPPLKRSDLSESANGPDVIIVRREGSGPGLARNAGVQHARGAVVLFTDDDTVPATTWLGAACLFLADHPDHLGVEGPTLSEPFDPLFFHSVSAYTPGTYLTCNVGYRRSTLDAVGGFAREFTSAHAEDLDLGFRVSSLGPVGYSADMKVEHPPKAVTLRWSIRRGRDLASDACLYRRHPHLYPRARFFTSRGYAFGLNVKHWIYSVARDTYDVRADPRRAARFLALAVGYSAVGAMTIVRDIAGPRK